MTHRRVWRSGKKRFLNVNPTRTLPNLGEGNSHRSHEEGNSHRSHEEGNSHRSHEEGNSHRSHALGPSVFRTERTFE